jgi:hypothetical protein
MGPLVLHKLNNGADWCRDLTQGVFNVLAADPLLKNESGKLIRDEVSVFLFQTMTMRSMMI